jgi:thiol-disulfide isomerase/thioredoxin
MLSLNLGPLAISVGQGLIIVAFVVALIAGKLAARRRDLAIGDTLFNLAFLGFVTARIAFVVHYYPSYGLDPLAWIDIRDGGFEMIPSLIVIGLCAIYLASRQPPLRGPLGVALFAGGLAWGLTGGALSLIENQTSRPPETELYTLEGTPTDLASLQQNAGNRPMVVNLWATWCPPCREEMPVLEQAQDERTDVLFVFANQREVVPTIRKFMDQMQLDMDHVVRDPRGGIGSQAGSAALPTTLFYNANGRLVDSHLGQLSKATLARALERFDLPSTESTQAKELP